MRPLSIVFIVSVVFCLSVMGSVLLAQQPDETDAPAPFDCSAEGVSRLIRTIEFEYYLDSTTDPTMVTDHLYQRGLSYQLLAMECGHIPNAAESRATSDRLHEMSADLMALQEASVGIDPLQALIRITSLVGDPSNGEVLYMGEERTTLGRTLGCAGCHFQGFTAPATEDIWDNVINTRIYQPELIGHIPHYYVVESIIEPDAYIIPGYVDLMPHNYGDQMSAQELADIVEYLHSFSADYVAPDPLPAIRPAPRSQPTATSSR
jgi:hypothetical protein